MIVQNIRCDGDGLCLSQTSENNKYTKLATAECQNNCLPVACANHKLCGSYRPLRCLKRGGICMGCDITFGKALTFVDFPQDICSICFEQGIMQVEMVNCQHSVCLGCFYKLNYGSDWTCPLPVDSSTLLVEYVEECEEEDLSSSESDVEMTRSFSCPLCRKDVIPGWAKSS